MKELWAVLLCFALLFAMQTDELSDVEYTRSLLNLGRMLEKHHQSKVVILIDEYDTPIQQGHSRNFYNEVITFMRNFMSGGLKDNYDITVEAFYNADNQLKVITVVENQDGEKVSGISFKNSYTWQGKDKSGPSLISKISKSNSVKTGDDSPIMGYFTLLLGSLVCLIALIRENQRKKKGDAENEAQ